MQQAKTGAGQTPRHVQLAHHFPELSPQILGQSRTKPCPIPDFIHLMTDSILQIQQGPMDCEISFPDSVGPHQHCSLSRQG